MKKYWIAFFSQTGSEINNVRKEIGRDPDLIITNRGDLEGINQELLKDCLDRFIFLPKKPTLKDYERVINAHSFGDAIITLHGYLRIVPEELCTRYEIYNLHPGLITKYPELRGFNPQKRAFEGHYKTAGAVIHRVISQVDAGDVLFEREMSIDQCTSEGEVLDLIHSLSTELWIEFFHKYLGW